MFPDQYFTTRILEIHAVHYDLCLICLLWSILEPNYPWGLVVHRGKGRKDQVMKVVQLEVCMSMHHGHGLWNVSFLWSNRILISSLKLILIYSYETWTICDESLKIVFYIKFVLCKNILTWMTLFQSFLTKLILYIDFIHS